MAEELTINFGKKGGPRVEASGTSPLEFDLPPELLAGGHYSAVTIPRSPGASVEQEVHYTLRLE